MESKLLSHYRKLIRRFAVSLVVTFCFAITNALGVMYEYTNRSDNIYVLIMLITTTLLLIVVYFCQARFILKELLPIYIESKKYIDNKKGNKDTHNE